MCLFSFCAQHKPSIWAYDYAELSFEKTTLSHMGVL